MENAVEIKQFGDLSIFVSGSYARLEASVYSDIDLFFVKAGGLNTEATPNVSSLRMFSKVVEIADELGFPAFSNDGEYFRILEKPKILEGLGGRRDDYDNHFTARLLMILESRCVFGQDNYDNILSEILEAYFRDYPDHPKDFQPTFLVNDIIRFWKTLCLNYENKRNQPPEHLDRKISQKIKNLKLKFSRLLTCYGSICYIISQNGQVGHSDILSMSRLTPLERLRQATKDIDELSSIMSSAENQYQWFLELTDVKGDDLLNNFKDKALRQSAFERANCFGDSIFELTKRIAEKNNYMRFLLV